MKITQAKMIVKIVDSNCHPFRDMPKKEKALINNLVWKENVQCTSNLYWKAVGYVESYNTRKK